MAATSKLSLTNHPMGDSLKYSVLLELLAQLKPNFERMVDLIVLIIVLYLGNCLLGERVHAPGSL